MKPLATGVLLALIPKQLVLNHHPRVRIVRLASMAWAVLIVRSFHSLWGGDLFCFVFCLLVFSGCASLMVDG